MASAHPRRTATVLALLCIAFVPALGVAPLAGATHEVGHRYFVMGTITNTSGLPLPGIKVTAEVPDATTHGLTPVWEGVTDPNGNFRILLHIHHLGGSEEDSGKQLIVRVPSAAIERLSTTAPSSPPAGEDSEGTGWGYTRVDTQLDRVAPTPPAPSGPADVGAWLANNALAVVVGVAVVAGVIVALKQLRSKGEEARLQRQELSVAKLPGVGRATAEKLRSNGISTIPQLARAKAPELSKTMGISMPEAQRLIRKATAHYRRDA